MVLILRAGSCPATVGGFAGHLQTPLGLSRIESGRTVRLCLNVDNPRCRRVKSLIPALRLSSHGGAGHASITPGAVGLNASFSLRF